MLTGESAAIEYAGPWPSCGTLASGTTNNDLLMARLALTADTCDVARLAATAQAEGNGIVSLGDGTSLAVGRFSGTLNGVASSGSDGFVTLFDDALQPTTTTALGGADLDSAIGSVREGDDVIVIGNSNQKLDQCFPGNASNSPTGFVVRYEAGLQSCAGLALVRKTDLSDSIHAVAAGLGEVVVVGDYDGPVTLDGAMVTPAGARDGFASRIDVATLSVDSTTHLPGAPSAEIALDAVAVDSRGRMLAGGSCASPAPACADDCALDAQCGFLIEP